ncbi:MAG: hypothetical protein R2764_13200 [Bacteroidales bacterium]
MILTSKHLISFVFLILIAVGHLFAQTSGSKEYEESIAKADQYFSNGDYINAKASYQYASNLNPEAEYPKTKLSETIAKLREKMAVMEQYNSTIAAADKHFKLKEYDQAKVKYSEASNVLPSEEYARNRIREIDNITAEADNKQAIYDEAIKKGDQFVKFKKYDKAKIEFETAISVFPDDQYAKDQLAELDLLIAELERVIAAYDKVIAAADRLFNLKYYKNAKEEYQKALDAKPDEVYPTEKIREIDEILVEKNEFDDLVAEADEFYMNKNLESAKTKYQAALTIYPSESYPKDMIDKINTSLNVLKSKDELYQKSIADADDFFNNKDYTNAKKEYENASGIKPDEAYPIQRIAEVETLLAKADADQLEYNLSVQRGEQYLTLKDYFSAKEEFEKANELKPNEAYPKQKLADLAIVLKEQQGIQDSFDATIATADQQLADGNYEKAIEEYQKALVYIPGSKYATEKIAESKRLSAEKTEREKQYQKLIAEADRLFEKAEYSESLARYEEAQKLKLADDYASGKIAAIGVILAGIRDKEDSYNQAIATADIFFNNGEYENALGEYQKANGLKPASKYPADRISEINGILNEKKSTEEKYLASIALADQLLESKQYSKSLKEYQAASLLKPDDSYPKNKITEVNQLIANSVQQENQYALLMVDADRWFKEGQYSDAKAAYEQALELKPEELKPKEQIAKIEDVMAAQKAIDDSYYALIAEGDQFLNKGEYSQAKEKYNEAEKLKPGTEHVSIKLAEIAAILLAAQSAQDAYETAVANADRLFRNEEYDKAKSGYEKALEFDPNGVKPKEQLVKIEEIYAQQKATEDSYNALIVEGDQFFEKGEYGQATAKYNEADQLKPGGSHTAAKLAAISGILIAAKSTDEAFDKAISDGDKFLAKKEYEAAKSEFQKASKLKPAANYPSQKITEIDDMLAQLDEQQNLYQSTIVSADGLFAEAKYELAKIEYQKAMEIKLDETYPGSKIKEIDEILKNQEFTSNLYVQTITAADALYEDGKYSRAIAEFEKATAMKPTEQYPKEKILEIKSLIAKQEALDAQYAKAIEDGDNLFKQKFYDQALIRYQNALELKPGEQHPRERVDDITSFVAAMDKENQTYSAAINEADGLFALKNYDEAKLAYMKASNIKPKEQYPRDKIDEIEQLISNQKAIQLEFNRMLAAADRMLESKDYTNAKSKYSEALIVLPDEQYPKDKIQEIDNLILAQELAVQESYNKLIADADALLLAKTYTEAKLKYQESLAIKPEENYPVQKLAEIEHLISDQETLKANYTKLIADADKLFKTKDYQEAKPRYVEASALFPGEEYPKTKIEEINLIFKNEMLRIQQDYDKAIADADKFFSSSVFDQALDSYRYAKKVKPDETYPDQMVTKILKILDENAVRDVVSSAVSIGNNMQEQFLFSPISITDRKSSLLFIKARNTSDAEFNVILSYGKGGAKNGGYSIPVKAGEGVKEYIIPIGNQYKWFTEDNDWISLVPQGGSVEVMLLKITHGN